MLLFLIIIISIYSAVHAYAFARARAAFPMGTAPGICLALFMAVMVFTPVLVRIMEKYGFDAPARLLSYIGYIWMGFLFLFFTVSLVTDLYRLTASCYALIYGRDAAALMPTARTAFLIPFYLGTALSLYAYFEALHIRQEKITIITDKIPETPGRVRIVQVSDVHLGLIVRGGRLERIIDAVKEASPDILVSTGDLVDGQIDSISDLADAMKEIRAPLGKYAVTGNHEFYAGLGQSLEITERAGFTVLRGEAVELPGNITIAGIDDPTAWQMHLSHGKRELDLLSRARRNTFIVLLKHQPIPKEDSYGLFDLQLSGHTHAGQIFPFRIIVRAFFPRVMGFHELPRGSHLSISRGSGTWGAPMRLLSPPEVTVIDLVRGVKRS
ncbi:metallophosphoesterase [bacterium]|nr:metallophosphoesterase [bacterium]